MKRIKLESGLYANVYSDAERDKTWGEVSQDISPVGKNIELFTPQDNKSYFIDKETEIKYDSYVAEIRANGKKLTVKYNICNQHAKTYSAVRKAYN
tara:strand:+ start:80 stop:367 length:288 start_codon:yes stop_codon:yes gene_type:complete